MANVWDADVTLTLDDARRLIESQFSALAPCHVEPLGAGWDNIALLINEHLVFRMPRRQIAARLIGHENFALPRLAPHLPLPVPVPLYLGVPQGEYPYPFHGYELLTGISALRVDLPAMQRADCAPIVGRFLGVLHGLNVDAATRASAPLDDLPRTDLAGRATRNKVRLTALAPLLARNAMDANVVIARMAELADTPPLTEPICWVHGDFYGAHLLLDDVRQPCGVIDWGDVHLGDPALDLSFAFHFLPFLARAAFRAAYEKANGPVAPNTWLRARFHALHYGATLADYGVKVEDPAFVQAGLNALRFALQDEASKTGES